MLELRAKRGARSERRFGFRKGRRRLGKFIQNRGRFVKQKIFGHANNCRGDTEGPASESRALRGSHVIVSLLSEPDRRIVGAGHRASFTHLIRVPGPAGLASRISIAARVGYCRDHNAIPIYVDVD